MVWQLTITDKLLELAKVGRALREAGVKRVCIGELQIELTDWEPPLVAPEQQQPTRGVTEIEYGDVFEDPDLYGIPGGKVPGLPRIPRDDE